MKNSKIIFIGSDHGGFPLKKQIIKYFKTANIAYADLGNNKLELQDDYPVFAQKVAQKVARGKGLGILLCRSGIGVCIAANKTSGIRAAQPFTPKMAQKAKEDDHVNILCLGADYLKFSQAKTIINAWLKAKPSKARRHQRRIDQIRQIEKKRK